MSDLPQSRGVLLGYARRGEREHAVWAWPDYGVVCPTLVTTNGAPRLVVSACQSYRPVVEALPVHTENLEAHLRAAYAMAIDAERAGKGG